MGGAPVQVPEAEVEIAEGAAHRDVGDVDQRAAKALALQEAFFESGEAALDLGELALDGVGVLLASARK